MNKATESRVLVVEPDRGSLDLIKAVLTNEEVQVMSAFTGEEAWNLFLDVHPRIVLAELSLNDMNGLELLKRVLAADPGVDFILMTADYTTQQAIDAVRMGACDCLSKPLHLGRLRDCIRQLRGEAITRQLTLQLDQDLASAYQFEGLVGRSPLMLEVFAKIRRVAPHFRSVLITGETGTGKELVAKAIHHLAPVSMAPFIVCDCSTLVETLMESQLFGYVRGAFTGAMQDKQGIFECANGGTVFLDEVGELSPAAQAKLLRVLQNGEIQRVGSPVCRRVDVRIIAATHRDLREMARRGEFREDLFYRLSAVEISVPSLAQRKEDLPLLLRHFVKKYSSLYQKEIAGITRRAQVWLAAHSWPGNVRELENMISGACIMCAGRMIDVQDLPQFLNSAQHGLSSMDDEVVTLEAIQQRHVKKVLSLVNSNKAKAAELLGISRSTLYDILRRIDLSAASDQLGQPVCGTRMPIAHDRRLHEGEGTLVASGSRGTA